MYSTIENYEELNIDGVTVTSRRGFKGNEKDGIMEVIEIIGRKEGVLKGEHGKWAKGVLYDSNAHSYTEAMEDWKLNKLPKFMEIRK